MPIQINNIAASTGAVRKQSPKFFSSALTGTGGAGRGLLNDLVRPNRIPTTLSASTDLPPVLVKNTTTQDKITTRNIPVGLLNPELVRGNAHRRHEMRMTVPELDSMFCARAYSPGQGPASATAGVYFDLIPQSITLREEKVTDSSGTESNVRHLAINYMVQMFTIYDDQDDQAWLNPSQPGNDLAVVYSYDAAKTIMDMFDSVRSHNETIDTADLDEWLDNYDVHGHLCDLAEAWSSDKIGQVVADCIEQSIDPKNIDTSVFQNLIYQMRYLENYSTAVALSAYRLIHEATYRHLPEAQARELSKHNVNLMMNENLDHLEKVKPQLNRLPDPRPDLVPSMFSTQQRNAVCTNDPLGLVQAGAGTGKSTTILGRVDYMTAVGVPQDRIMALSFTNAAADHLKGKNPYIKSMTIAKMIHLIYSMNHPGHEPSTEDTMINAIDIYYDHDDLAHAFRERLVASKRKEPGAGTAMNSFVENNREGVLKILDTIKQVSLDLEIMICYQEIDTMVEPPEVDFDHLILDEVQDNSIFEFIFVLKYVAKNRKSLYLVGDCSQTLFEFRSSNPKALNALEASGVFTTFQLTTNYRSNQAILDFANVGLNNIEANQFAKIQLQSNDIAPVTADMMKERVWLDYTHTRKKGEFQKNLTQYMHNKIVRDFVDRAMDANESVAVLAYSRKDVAAMQEGLAQVYPNATIVDMVPEKTFVSTVFSSFVKDFWNDIRQVPPVNAPFAITTEMQKNINSLIKNPSAAAVRSVQEMLQKWWLSQNQAINAWLGELSSGAIPQDVFFERLRQSLLRHEVDHNGMKERMVSTRNKQRKEENLRTKADIYVSTIHSAKGLEFPHTIVLHNHESDMSEADKRMFYVAFTRAQKTELVISYGTLLNPSIVSDYNTLISELEKADQVRAQNALAAQAAGAAQGVGTQGPAQPDPSDPSGSGTQDDDGDNGDDTAAPAVPDPTAAAVAAPAAPATAQPTTGLTQQGTTAGDADDTDEGGEGGGFDPSSLASLGLTLADSTAAGGNAGDTGAADQTEDQ